MDTNNDMANQVLNNPKTIEEFMRLMVDLVYEGFEKRRAPPHEPRGFVTSHSTLGSSSVRLNSMT
jgi:hypothetical protein